MAWLDALQAHLWTVWPTLRASTRSPAPPDSRPWSTRIESDRGPLRLTGLWREETAAPAALLVLHGLGGSVERPYCVAATRAASAMGWSCLRLAMRGADRQGEDFYHAGLYEDVDLLLRRSPLNRYPKVFVLGYSVGGHVALRLACGNPDPRLCAVATVGSPLDLDRSARHIDQRAWPLYRKHLLRGLLEMAAAIGRRGRLPTAMERLRRVETLREWDTLTVAPRFGFLSAEDYYSRESVGPRLGDLCRPTLYVGARFDPVVSFDSIVPSLRNANGLLEVRWLRSGGHASFPPRVRLDREPLRSLELQILDWLARHVDD